MKPLLAATALLLFLSFRTAAQEENAGKGNWIDISADARIDFQYDANDGHTDDSRTGFEPKYLNFMINGELAPGLTYSWRQRIYKRNISNMFDATDWIWLKYEYRGWAFSAGKEVVGIGGWEYDAAPINIFQGSVFWNNIACYQAGATVGYNFTPTDKLSIQAVQSPFHTSDNRNMYAYNLMWSGRHGIFEALWSANMLEYAKGKYISYISLGNRFNAGPVCVELDLINRAADHQTYFFKDASVMAQVAYKPTERWRISAKYTYDVNRTNTAADLTVLPGTELNMAGATVEFWPLLKKRTYLRAHAGCFYSWGKNANSADVMQNKSLFISAGITWDMDIFSLKRK